MQAERLLAAEKEVEAKFKYSLIVETLEERIEQRYSAILYLYEELLLQAKENIEKICSRSRKPARWLKPLETVEDKDTKFL